MDELMGNLNSIEAKDVVSSTYVPESTGFGRGENVNGAENQSVIAERHAHYRKVANNAQKKAS
jgi:hypothetical protein